VIIRVWLAKHPFQKNNKDGRLWGLNPWHTRYVAEATNCTNSQYDGDDFVIK
jgi:hypothetical protein